MATRRVIRLAAAMLIGLLLLGAGCGPTDPSLDRVRQSGVLRVGLDPTYPPFALAEGDSLSGLEVDVAEALADELGVRTQFTYFGYDGLYDALATGQVDVLISGLVMAPEKTRDFAYSLPYFDAGQVLVRAADDAIIDDMTDLRDSKLAVELGSAGATEAERWARRIPGLTVVAYETATAALDAVVGDESDAALVDHVSARLYGDGPAAAVLRRISPPIRPEPLVAVVRIEDRSLLDAMNEAMAQLQQSGRLEQISTVWLGD